MLYLSLALLSALALAASPLTLAIQQSNETYLGYMTLTDCPPALNLTPGSIALQTLTPTTIFEGVQEADGNTFWGVVEGGQTLLLNEQQIKQLGQAEQLVYFNSSLSSDFRSRQFILSSSLPNGNLNLTFATATATIPNHLSLQTTHAMSTNFSQQTLQLLEMCQSPLQLSFVGSSSYLGLCPNSSLLIVFNPYYQNQSILYWSAEPIVAAAPNPELLLPLPGEQELWQVALLLKEGSTILFCRLNQLELECSDYQQDLGWLSVVASRAWEEQTSQAKDLASIEEIYPGVAGLNFPGTILSILANQQIVYIESVLQEVIFLAVLQGDTLLVNCTLPGSVVYFGSESVVTQTANLSLVLVQFSLPFFQVGQTYQGSTYAITETCQGTTYELEYGQIVWTSLDYPSAAVYELESSQRMSTLGVLTYGLEETFQVIGPAFQVFIDSSSPLKISLLDAPVLRIGEEIVALLEVDILSKRGLPQLSVVLYFLTHDGQLQSVSPDTNYQKTVARNPCGFNTIVSALKQKQQYLITNDLGQICLCSPLMTKCILQTAAEPSPSVVSAKPAALEAELGQSAALKNQLYGLLRVGLLINIYQSGVVSLATLSGETLDQLISGCPFNCTNALLFTRNYKDDLLLVFCQGASQIGQYTLRQQTLVFNRIIPLYGFTTRTEGVFFPGTNYVYLEADPDPNYASPNLLPQGPLCCVLRLDPSAFTVSVIAEIVEAQELVFVETVMDLDLVYYNSTGVYKTSPFLKIYYPATWISFSGCPVCTDPPCAPQTYSYSLTLASLPFNFAASFSQSITFDLSASSLSRDSEVSLGIPLSSPPAIEGLLQFGLNWVCGPVMQYDVVSNDSAGLLYSLAVNEVVTQNKLLVLPAKVLQVIDLGQALPSSALSPFILAVTEQTLVVYNKFEGVWMKEELQMRAPNSNCYYFVYSVPDPFSVELASNCFDLIVATPRLTLSFYNQSLNYSFDIFAYPQQLRRVVSFPVEGSAPLVLGFQDGPTPSRAGLLTYCQDQCVQLSFSGQIEIVLAYDACYSEGILTVVALTRDSLYLWENLAAPGNSSIGSSCQVSYLQALGTCRSLSFLSRTQNSLNLLVGCQNFYQEISLGTCQYRSLQILNSYRQFNDCDVDSVAQPAFTLTEGRIELLAMECLHNRQTVLTQQFESINSSTNSIVTAYLQIYAPSGPFCSEAYHPLRILPLSVSHPSSTHLFYAVNSQLKLVHQQIDGLLVDSFVDGQPQIKIAMTQILKQPQYPQLSLVLQNPYYQLTVPLALEQPPSVPNRTAAIILQALFLATNLITLLALICWFAFRRNILRGQGQEMHPSRIDVNGFTSVNGRSSQHSEPSEESRPSLRPTQRRVTQIQLFQPRYNLP